MRQDGVSEAVIAGDAVIGPFGALGSPYRDLFHTGSIGESESLDFRLGGTGAGGSSSSSDNVKSMTA